MASITIRNIDESLKLELRMIAAENSRSMEEVALGETSLMFLVHPTLTDEEIEKTCKVVAEVMGRVREIS